MHTSHLFKGNKLLLVGGRSLKANEEGIFVPEFRDTISAIDLETGEFEEEFARLPTALASHQSWLVEDKYIVIYGGTNGGRFFDSVIRYDIEKKEWTLLSKYPESAKSSTFFKEGRIAHVSASVPNTLWILFGGCTPEQEFNDFLVLDKAQVVDDSNFSVITEIM